MDLGLKTEEKGWNRETPGLMNRWKVTVIEIKWLAEKVYLHERPDESDFGELVREDEQKEDDESDDMNFSIWWNRAKMKMKQNEMKWMNEEPRWKRRVGERNSANSSNNSATSGTRERERHSGRTAARANTLEQAEDEAKQEDTENECVSVL